MSWARVRDVMTESVVVTTPDCAYQQLVDALADTGVSALPVVDQNNRVLGVVSEADVLQHDPRIGGKANTDTEPAEHQRRDAGRAPDGGTARDIMTSPAITITQESSIHQAARLMLRHHVKRLLVVDPESGAMIGIVSRHDLLRRYLRSDEAIQRDVVDEVLTQTLWLDPSHITATATDGVVTLTGKVDRRSTAVIAGQLVRGVDGVVAVNNEIGWDADDTTRGSRNVSGVR